MDDDDGPRDEGTIDDDDDDVVTEDSVGCDVSGTRDTTNRLREGLSIGLATGDETGLGAGDRRRPPLTRFGSSFDDRTASSFRDVITDGDVHGSV